MQQLLKFFLLSVSLSILLNVTANLYMEELKPLVPFGWLCVALYATYLIASWLGIGRHPKGINRMWLGYTLAIAIGGAFGGTYWALITRTFRVREQPPTPIPDGAIEVSYDLNLMGLPLQIPPHSRITVLQVLSRTSDAHD